MNKNLNKLYKIAVESVPDDTETLEESMQIFTETIAELIVRECANIASTAEPWKSDDLIFKHFGIKA